MIFQASFFLSIKSDIQYLNDETVEQNDDMIADFEDDDSWLAKSYEITDV